MESTSATGFKPHMEWLFYLSVPGNHLAEEAVWSDTWALTGVSVCESALLTQLLILFVLFTLRRLKKLREDRTTGQQTGSRLRMDWVLRIRKVTLVMCRNTGSSGEFLVVDQAAVDVFAELGN
ncbi:hypothetical protein T265_04141 [Opisthorchis viverrini]|uniref:Uncharacterized protein n=1 Tax=Opisthorchis viverrini TaxID=6198 RepID=A0A074ZQ60_OPIVI|nr:hypothetical protein T265_04141 [Opisthorchis viverrini]KER29211.1 hypothetical protein T265_04141 [Opisthorchis viverrini]